MRLIFATLALLLFVVAGSAYSQGRPVKIGLLLPYSGPLTVQGTDTTRGFELYINRIGMKAGGREIQILREDTEAKPDVGLTKIRKLIERDAVDFVIGPVNSAVALAIRDYVHQRGVPLIVPIAFTRLLTAPPLASPFIFRIIETSDQANYPMGEWMIKNTKHRRAVLMATDFVAASGQSLDVYYGRQELVEPLDRLRAILDRVSCAGSIAVDRLCRAEEPRFKSRLSYV